MRMQNNVLSSILEVERLPREFRLGDFSGFLLKTYVDLR